MSGMKRIKQIIEALRVLSRTPSKTIAKASNAVVSTARDDADIAEEEINLIETFLAAVITIAEDMEKPTKADGEVAK